MKIDPITHELICKVVYVGPGMSGKTSNLQFIRKHAPADAVGDMVSIDSDSERTLQFDLLPLDIGTVKGYRCRFQFYTVPGQSYYAAIRRSVIAGADGIIFVCDSRREAMDENIESMNDLYDHLRHHKLPDTLPTIIQYNKQDLPTALPVEQLNPLLNHRNLPYFKASVVTGVGILDTLKKISHMVIDTIAKRDSLDDLPTADQTEPSPFAGTPPPSTATESGSWLLTCYNCESLLEVPHANPGDVFTCGSCRAPLEVVDGNRGLTRRPATLSEPAAAPPPPPQEQNRITQDDSYAMQALSEDNATALSTQMPAAQDLLTGAASFALPGFTRIAELDSSLLGHRYRVREERSGTMQRALVLSPPLMRQPGYESQFEPALRNAAAIHHRNLIRVISLSRQHDSPVILSEDCPDHEPLSLIIQRRGRLQAPQIMGIIRQMALVLEEAGRHGVIHGWIRPEVILVDAEGQAVLDDLGIPKPYAYIVRESLGSSASTEHYLAPEHLITDTPIDFRTDMFLLGAVLFRALTGQSLVTGYSAHEALHRINASGCKSLRGVDPDVSRGLDAFYQRLTAVERKDRFDSYRDLLETLDAFGGGAHRNTLKVTRSVPAARRTATSMTPTRNPSLGNSPPHGSPITHTPVRSHRLSDATSQTPTRNATLSSRPTEHATASRRHTGTIHRTGRHDQPVTTRRGTTGHGHHETLHHHRGHQHARHASGGWFWWLLLIATVFFAFGYIYNQVLGHPLPFFSEHRRQAAPAAPSPVEPVAPPLAEPDRREPKPGVPEIADTSPASLLAQAEEAHRRFLSNPHNRAHYEKAMQAVIQVLESDASPNQRRQAQAWRQDLVSRVPVSEHISEEDAADTAPGDVPDIQRRIDHLVSAQRFFDATSLARDLFDDEAQRGQVLDSIRTAHHQAWQELIDMVISQATSLEKARDSITSAIETWNMPEDDRRGTELLDRKRAMATPEERSEDGSTTAPSPDTMSPADNDAPVTDRDDLRSQAIRIDRQLDRLLLTGEQEQAEALIASIIAESPEAQALQRKQSLWQGRAERLQTAFARRPLRMRVTPPLPGTHQPWDIIVVHQHGIQIQGPGGTRMDVDWQRIHPDELGELFVRAMASDDASAIELATAAVVALITGRFGDAEQLRQRAQTADYAHGPDLRLLVDLWREREMQAIDDAITEARQRNDIARLKALDEDLRQPGLRRQDPEGLRQKRIAQSIEDIRAGRTRTTALRDHLHFDEAEDLDSFPNTSGSWSVGGGRLRNLSDGRLARDDCGNVQAMTLRFMTEEAMGGLTVDFRGTTMIIDLAAQRYHLRSRGERLEDRSFPFVANTIHTLRFALSDTSDRLLVEINQADPVNIDPGSLTTTIALQVDTGATIFCEDIRLRRSGITATAPTDHVNDEARAQLRDVLGLLPLGLAYKDPESPSIVLPDNGTGQASGIGIARHPESTGIGRFEITGSGTLLLGLCRVEDDRLVGTRSRIDLPGPGTGPVAVIVTWRAGEQHYTMRLEQRGTEPQTIRNPAPDDPTHFIIQVQGNARIPVPPVLERP